MVMPYKWKVHKCEVSKEEIITEFNCMITLYLGLQNFEVLVKGGI